MNRLILIGNGFDLAHGLKTSYADFIEWYWNEWGKRLRNGKSKLEEDRFYSFRLSDSLGVAAWYLVWSYCVEENPKQPWSNKEVLSIAKTRQDLCTFKSKSDFFEKICDHLQRKKWVDVEDIFYVFLKKSFVPKHINDDLEFLKNKLVDYLKSLQEATVNPYIQKQILEPFHWEDIAISSMDKWDKKMEPDNIMILNFNYTNTADMYLPKAYNYSVNHIHGSLSNPEGVIFGYGDERDDEYEVLMKKNDDEYLQHIKSFRYLEASNYRDMLSFIESAPYQLCIMGHSCGLSDRTLLATLFEHRNCVSIKPYYYKRKDGTDNYRELVQNIARNFKDPTLMRDRVVRKDRCEPLG